MGHDGSASCERLCFITPFSAGSSSVVEESVHLSLAAVGLKGTCSICVEVVGIEGMNECTGLITTTHTHNY